MQNMIVNITNKKAFLVILCSILCVSLFIAFAMVPDAYALTIGGQEIEGYQPKDMIESDIKIDADDPSQIAPKFEKILIVFVSAILPILMVACVALIIYNAIRNIFRKEEEKVKIGKLIKEIFVGFFWILFAWIIVEVIVFIVTNGETLIYNILFT